MNCQFTITQVLELQNGTSTLTLQLTSAGDFAQAGTAPTGTLTLTGVSTPLVAAFIPGTVVPCALT
jgi:hypothetical protein